MCLKQQIVMIPKATTRLSFLSHDNQSNNQPLSKKYTMNDALILICDEMKDKQAMTINHLPVNDIGQIHRKSTKPRQACNIYIHVTYLLQSLIFKIFSVM